MSAAARRASSAPHYPPDAPPMTADQMRRQDATVLLLKEAVAAQDCRVVAWLQASLTVVPAKRERARHDPEAD